MYEREKLKWNGWGWTDSHYEFSGNEASFWRFLKTELGCQELKSNPPLALEQVSLPPCRLSEAQLLELQAQIGANRVYTSHFERIFHARGRSFSDLPKSLRVFLSSARASFSSWETGSGSICAKHPSGHLKLYLSPLFRRTR